MKIKNIKYKCQCSNVGGMIRFKKTDMFCSTCGVALCPDCGVSLLVYKGDGRPSQGVRIKDFCTGCAELEKEK